MRLDAAPGWTTRSKATKPQGQRGLCGDVWGHRAQRSRRVTLWMGLIDLKQWPGWLAHGKRIHLFDKRATDRSTLLTTLMPRLCTGALFISMIPHLLLLFSDPASTTLLRKVAPFSLGESIVQRLGEHGDIGALAGLIRRAARQPWTTILVYFLSRLRLSTHSPSFFLPTHSVELHSFARSVHCIDCRFILFRKSVTISLLKILFSVLSIH